MSEGTVNESVSNLPELLSQANSLSDTASRAISFVQKTWTDSENDGTTITATELNRLEQAITDLNTTLSSVQDSLSRIVTLGPSVSLATVDQIGQDSPQLVTIRVAGDFGDVSLIATRNGIGLWNDDEKTMIGRLSWGA